MLYEFHRSENEKKPKSVHATYLLTGISGHTKPLPLSRNHLKDGEDEVMQSSPVVGSQPAQPETTETVAGPAITSVLLVPEEELEGKSFESGLGPDYANVFYRCKVPFPEGFIHFCIQRTADFNARLECVGRHWTDIIYFSWGRCLSAQ